MLRRYRWHIAFLAVMIPAIVLAAKAQGAILPQNTSVVRTASVKPLKLVIYGRCRSASNGGQLELWGTGFTPTQRYSWKVWYPNSQPYYYYPHGIRDAKVLPFGVVHMIIGCSFGAGGKPDPPGVYTVQLTDEYTDRQVSIKYTIEP